MAEKGDSRNALIISLSIFVVLAIGLGVSTYYGFRDKDKLEKAADQAKADAKKSEDGKNWEKYQELLLRAYISHNTMTAPEREQLATLQAASDNLGKDEPNRKSFESLREVLNDKCKWDANKKQPRQSLMGKVESLEAEVQSLEGALTKSNDNIARLKRDYEASKASAQAELDELQKSLQAKSKELADALGTKSAEYIRVAKIVEDRDNQLEQKSQEVQQSQENYRRTVEGKERKIKELQNNFDRLNDVVNPKSVVDYAQAKGSVVEVDRRGVVYINLGSADYVKPQLSFSVFAPSRTGRAEGERKAALEVVTVVGPHQSKARIVPDTLRDAGMSPIMPGDQLYNPAWNPTVRQHVAIAGLVDLTGSGRDDLAEFMLNLRRQGIEIDAYLDLKTNTIQGAGITRQTEYLILGPEPEFDDTIAQRTDANTRKKEVADRMNEMKTQAKQEGVSPVKLETYLAMTGYRVPRATPGVHTYERIQGGVQRKESAPPADKADTDK
jgi:Skp family chaperone for outer membrane proteins